MSHKGTRRPGVGLDFWKGVGSMLAIYALIAGVVLALVGYANGEGKPLIPDTVKLEPERGAKSQYPDNRDDALDELNAWRVRNGYRPYLRDEGLTVAARGAAKYRADNLIFGHVTGGMGDFQFVPPGTTAASAGCAAYPASYGWLSCCMRDNYTYAGAAWWPGRDGKRYMHVFVR